MPQEWQQNQLESCSLVTLLTWLPCLHPPESAAPLLKEQCGPCLQLDKSATHITATQGTSIGATVGLWPALESRPPPPFSMGPSAVTAAPLGASPLASELLMSATSSR